MKEVVVFSLNNRKYAIPCNSIEQIVNIVAITLLPHAPKKILGIINVHGKIVAVLNLATMLELPERKRKLSDKIIIVKTKKRSIAFIVDKIEEIISIQDDKIVNLETVMPDPDIYEGTLKLKDGLVMIYNINKFLSLDEETELSEALD